MKPEIFHIFEYAIHYLQLHIILRKISLLKLGMLTMLEKFYDDNLFQ